LVNRPTSALVTGELPGKCVENAAPANAPMAGGGWNGGDRSDRRYRLVVLVSPEGFEPSTN
jgi:hypothetical protein